MGNIVLLDDLTINKIAAGEVIERPANVVKELVENSIDAGSTNIIVEIKNGGKTYIKVTDDGSGINVSDMVVSLERHATSKIRSIEDLEKTYTMGFRGEALASIVAISKLTMISKTKDEEFGNKIIGKAGEIIYHEQVGTSVGTTIIVEDLFFNTPVRYKFLKQDATEFKYIKEWLQKVALANPNIAFKLINDRKNIFQTSGNGDIRDIIYTLYGKEIKENLIDVNYNDGQIKVTGVVGTTVIANDTRKNQIVFLNKRNIKNAIITNSADQAFKGATGIGKYGFFILNLEMEPNLYDINVHPTKMEVRFTDEQKIYKCVYHAIKSSILNKEFLGNSEIEEKNDYVENELEFLTNHFTGSNLEKTSKLNEDISLIHRNLKRDVQYIYIGIILKTYIIIQVEDNMFLIDQHAAHERILYEQIKNNYKNNLKRDSQMMLVPEVINLSHREFSFLQENIELIRNIGFDVETFGENSIKVNGIPDIDYKVDSKNLLLEILDEMLTNQRSPIKDIEERFIATVACKAAVKAGMVLEKSEVDYLIQTLLSLNNPYTCPHGRPTTVMIRKEDIVKQLGGKE